MSKRALARIERVAHECRGYMTPSEGEVCGTGCCEALVEAIKLLKQGGAMKKVAKKKISRADAALKDAIMGVAKRASKKPVAKQISPTDAAWKRIWADFDKQYRGYEGGQNSLAGMPGWPTQRKMIRAAVERELREGGPVAEIVVKVKGDK